MCKNEMPLQVVRFYGNTDYALECIALKQITFVHIGKLNDPFDPVHVFFTDFNNSYEVLLSHVEQYHFQQLSSFKEKLPEPNWKKIVTSLSNIESRLQASSFVFSACAVRKESHPRDNLYMWGHYGNGHRGVAVEFNTTALAELNIKQDAPDSEFPWWEMKYKKEIPSITCENIVEFVLNAQPNADNLELFRPKLYSVIHQRLHSKGEVWQKEDEWRLVRENDETKLKIVRHDIPNNAIAAVYLGCRAAEQEQLRCAFIYETQRHFPSAKVFRANMRSGKYALDFEEIA